MTCNFCGRVVTSGITRLKQHLAGIEGDIAPCPKVSRAVREDMKKLIFEWQAKQKQKKTAKKQLEKEIIQMHESGQYNDNDDEEEEDIMQYARQQSLRQLEIDSYKMTKGVHYDAGGSSASQQRKRMLGHSFSVRNTANTQNPRGNNP